MLPERLHSNLNNIGEDDVMIVYEDINLCVYDRFNEFVQYLQDFYKTQAHQGMIC